MSPNEVCELIRDKWLAGWSDRNIGVLVNLSERSVRTRRVNLALTLENYPKRKPLQGRVKYSPAEEQDIITRINRGEPIDSVARRYRVARSRMKSKVEQLQMRGRVQCIPDSRKCLRCRLPFISKLPKSINRICSTCMQEADWGGLI